MGKKFAVKAKKMNKVKQPSFKAGKKNQKFNKPNKSPVSPKMVKNASFDSKKGKNKVTFSNDNQKMKTPQHQKGVKSPNTSFKASVSSRKSLVSERKGTPFPHSGKLKPKKVFPVVEEEEGSDEMDISQSEGEGTESDVSFDEMGSFSGDSALMDEGTEEESEEEIEEKAPPKVIEKQPPLKKKDKSNGSTPVEPKKPNVGQSGVKIKAETPKQVEDKAVKRKREILAEKPAKKPAKMTAEEYTADSDKKRVFVTNLPENVTDDEVRSLHPQIKDFALLCAYRKRKGSAILVFLDESSAEKGKAEMTGKKLRGREIVVDFVGEKNSRKDAKTLGPVVPGRLYVGNIGEHCTEANLREIFVGATMVSVPSQKRHTFGFIEFGDADDAMDALIKNNYTVYKGEKMIVQFARAKVEENTNKVSESNNPAKVKSESRGMVVEDVEDSDGEDIGDEDSNESEGEDDESEESDGEENSPGGDDLESFDDESD